MLSSSADWLNQTLKDVPPSLIVAGSVGGTLAAIGASRILANPIETKDKVLGFLFKNLKSLPGVSGKLSEIKAEVRKKIIDSLNKEALPGLESYKSLPAEGLPYEEVLRVLKELHDHEAAKYTNGKISGAVYVSDPEYVKMLNEAYSLFSLTNPLHADLFPSSRKFESEIVSMTASLMHGDEHTVGNVTSGGSESILMAVKTYRDLAGKKNPEMVVPITVHAAFDKAAHYFGVKIIHVPLDKDLRVDVRAVERAITSNTILIVGSAPNFPHGIVDPIAELAALAKRKGIYFHTDACLGGYYLPFAKKYNPKIPDFDFAVDGVTSISIDTHKYGYTTKGTSVLLFKNADIRRHMFHVITEWPGGTYGSPTISGSRAGGLLACAWAALVANGHKGYSEKAEGIYKTAEIIKAGIGKIEPLFLLGDSQSSVIAFSAKGLNIYKVNDQLSKRGWNLNAIHKPEAVHLCLTSQSIGLGPQFLADLEASVAHVKANPGEKGGNATMYGLAATFPDRSEVADIAITYLESIATLPEPLAH